MMSIEAAMRPTEIVKTSISILSLKLGRRHLSAGASRPVQAATHGAHADEQQPSSISNKHSGIPEATGSAKLFADALLEEESSSSGYSDATERTSARAARLVQAQTEENWTGDENIRDTVLRMLVDKYKPLRGPGIRNADEKMKERPPTVRPASSPPPSLESDVDSASSSPSLGADTSLKMEYKADWKARAAEPLLPGIEGHRPWHTTFTPPSSTTARIKAGSFTPSSTRRSAVPGSEDTVKIDIAAARRTATAQRLGRARESTLDYRLGVSRAARSREGSSGELRRPMPLDQKGWASLVEERIERARLEGQFRTLSGRGKPIVQETAERNPFIAREEFLMNRIVQRNQAAPPWVELQGELEDAIQTFRTMLIQAWTRRAIRLLTATRPALSLEHLTLSDARALRDESWAAREAGYHATALGEVNELVRRYNGVAPYAVRKPYFVKETELEKVYWESGEGVLEGVRERLRKGGMKRTVDGGSEYGDEDGGGGGGGSAASRREQKKRNGIWKMVRGWIADLRTT